MTIDLTAAIEAAAEVVRRNTRVRPHETVIDAAVVPSILGAAAPLIETAVREQIAQEIEAQIYPHPTHNAFVAGEIEAGREAARIARGEQ